MAGPFNSRRSPVLSLTGGASTDDPLATAAAVELLSQGGNAADAAVAAAAALQVLKPYATGVGGDCFALFYCNRTRRVLCIDGSGHSPAALTRELFEAAKDTGMEATVPGAVKGWFDLLQHCGSGKVLMADVLAPAIRLARQGFPVGVVNAAQWRTYDKKLSSMVGGGVFLPPPRSGEVLHNEPLAKLLERVGREGPRAFYEGAVAEAVAAAVCAAGGVLSAADLARHLREGGDGLADPASTTYRGVRVHTPPLPSQGSVLLEALNLLEGFALRGLDWGSYQHLLVEALRTALADGLAWVAHAGPAARDGRLALKEHAASRQPLDPDRVLARTGRVAGGEQSDTTFLVTADWRGNVCAFVNSNFLGFGCAVVPEHGFAVHCRGRGFSVEAGHPNCAGAWKKPYHTLMAVLVTDEAQGGRCLAALGSMGGYGQPQVDLQLLLAMLERRLNPQQALDMPRFFIGHGHQLRPGDDLVLDDGFPEDAANDLRRRGHIVHPRRLSGLPRCASSMAHIVARSSFWEEDPVQGSPPVFWFGCDPRCDGVAIAAPPPRAEP